MKAPTLILQCRVPPQINQKDPTSTGQVEASTAATERCNHDVDSCIGLKLLDDLSTLVGTHLTSELATAPSLNGADFGNNLNQ